MEVSDQTDVLTVDYWLSNKGITLPDRSVSESLGQWEVSYRALGQLNPADGLYPLALQDTLTSGRELKTVLERAADAADTFFHQESRLLLLGMLERLTGILETLQ